MTVFFLQGFIITSIGNFSSASYYLGRPDGYETFAWILVDFLDLSVKFTYTVLITDGPTRLRTSWEAPASRATWPPTAGPATPRTCTSPST